MGEWFKIDCQWIERISKYWTSLEGSRIVFSSAICEIRLPWKARVTAKVTARVTTTDLIFRGVIQPSTQKLVKTRYFYRIGTKKVSGQLNKIVQKLITNRLIERTIPDKPNHPAQKFQLTERGRAFLSLLDNSKSDEEQTPTWWHLAYPLIRLLSHIQIKPTYED